jgi:hypothetical protein
MASDSLIPRGNPLTEVMPVTTAQGCRWIAYIDGYDPVRPRHLIRQTVLPGRRLRFDSATDSRISLARPAGSPFLEERKLIALLAASHRLGDEPIPAAPQHPARAAASAAWRRRLDWARLLAGAVNSLEHAVLEKRWARS